MCISSFEEIGMEMNMVRCKGRYEIITVIITILTSNTYLKFVVTCVACCLEEVFWKKLTLLIEVVGSAVVD